MVFLVTPMAVSPFTVQFVTQQLIGYALIIMQWVSLIVIIVLAVIFNPIINGIGIWKICHKRRLEAKVDRIIRESMAEDAARASHEGSNRRSLGLHHSNSTDPTLAMSHMSDNGSVDNLFCF